MIHTEFRKTSGFTLTELLVVIGIMTVLMALIVPATRSLSRGNRVQRCSLQLQQIGNALKADHLDYRGVPPHYPADTDNPLDGTRDEVVGPGLRALWELDYLRSRGALHCPNDKEYKDPNESAYYLSYMDMDPDAKVGDAANEPYHDWNEYKYLSTRGITDSSDPDYYRQLDPARNPDDVPDQGEIPAFDTSWHPDDTTVVTWCNLHTKHFKRQVQGQETINVEEMYQVLFWDGSVKVIPARLLTDEKDNNDDDLPPDAAWKVHPDDELTD